MPTARGRRASVTSPRGWAKIMRPATVWSTRVTVTGISLLPTDRAPFSMTIIVPSLKVADALA